MLQYININNLYNIYTPNEIMKLVIIPFLFKYDLSHSATFENKLLAKIHPFLNETE